MVEPRPCSQARSLRPASPCPQQRLTIARALSQEPDLLLLDEFSIAIDPVTTMRIEDVLKELKQEITIVLVTNLVQQARRLTDHAAGTVEVLGKDILAPDVEVVQLRKQVGMVFQRPNPLPLSIRDNVLFGYRVHEAAARRMSRAALDPAGTEAVEELLWELRGDYTILIVTHNMAQAPGASDECAFMLLGKIIEHGKTTELFVTPQRQETADYIEGRYG